MLPGDVRGEAIRRDLLAAEPAEGLAGRDVDALHCTTSMGDCRLDVKGGAGTPPFKTAQLGIPSRAVTTTLSRSNRQPTWEVSNTWDARVDTMCRRHATISRSQFPTDAEGSIWCRARQDSSTDGDCSGDGV